MTIAEMMANSEDGTTLKIFSGILLAKMLESLHHQTVQ